MKTDFSLRPKFEQHLWYECFICDINICTKLRIIGFCTFLRRNVDQPIPKVWRKRKRYMWTRFNNIDVDFVHVKLDIDQI